MTRAALLQGGLSALYNGVVTAGTGVSTNSVGGTHTYIGCGTFTASNTITLGTETPAFSTATLIGQTATLAFAADVVGGAAVVAISGFAADPTSKFLAFASLRGVSQAPNPLGYIYSSGTGNWTFPAQFGFGTATANSPFQIGVG